MAIVALSLAAGGCEGRSALEELSAARQMSADLTVQFTKSSDAANKAVMADTDEASVAFAGESEQATQAVQKTVSALEPLLKSLNYSDEIHQLEEFSRRFADYRELDRRILDMAVRNTNLKAERLSFGPAQEAADSFRDALTAVAPLAPADKWRVEALVETAVATVREIQVLQAPHIANADDAVMARMEKSMATSEAAARNVLKTLGPLVQPASRPKIAAAVMALDRFADLNAQIIALSRQNTNVRSLALSLNEKAKAAAACEDALRALRDDLARHGSGGTR